MKKYIIILMLCLFVKTNANARVITPKTYNSKAKESIFTANNSIDVSGCVTKIKKIRNGKRKIYVTCYGDTPQYDGHVYTITLTKREFKSWQKEEGKVRKGTNVIIWLYKMETKKVTDDVVLNIRKGE